MINSVVVAGRLADNPIKKTTTNGLSVCNFSVAIKGTQENEVDYIDFTAWRGTADTIEKYCRKGDQVIIQGRLKTDTYQDTNGNKRKKVFVMVNTFEFGAKKQGQTQEEGSYVQNIPPDDVVAQELSEVMYP